VEQVLRAGDLEFSVAGPARSSEGIFFHQKLQQQRPEGYEKEVPVRYETEMGPFVVEVTGRIDGVFHEPGKVVIEEIKTTRRSLDEVQREPDPLHWAQAMGYAYMYAAAHGLEGVDAQVTYYHVVSGATWELRRSFSLDELEGFFCEIVTHYVQWAGSVDTWQRVRDASIKELAFPYPSYRNGQRQMAVAVYKTIKDRGQVIIQAPTGIGKTMAALFPAIKALGEGLTAKIVYLCARTTGKSVAEQALEAMRTRGLRLKSLTLTAKDKICFQPERTCTALECPYARGYFDRVDGAVRDIFRSDAFTFQSITQTAARHRVCPFELSLDLCLCSDCIVCDYNYAFDPRVVLRRLFLEAREPLTLLVDEAHNLVDRAREMFSAQVRKGAFLEVRRMVRGELPEVYGSLGKINAWLLRAGKRCETAGGTITEKDAPAALVPLVRDFVELAEASFSPRSKAPYAQALSDLYFEARVFLRVAEEYDSRHAACYEKTGKDLTLKLLCIDPSSHLRKALKRRQGACFFSATMDPSVYFKTLLGCEPSVQEVFLASPFPRGNLCLLILDSVSTLYRHRDRTKDKVAEALAALVCRRRGNYLLFFPSYAYMQMVHEVFVQRCPETETVVQSPGMSEQDREDFLNGFTACNPRTLVGFAVMGGVFGEAIDLVGRRLDGAGIVGVGLPGVSAQRELIRDYFTRTMGAGFEYAYLYPGINRVLQAAGRVIRTETDRGVVFLIDERFSEHRYSSLLRQDWVPVRVQDPGQVQKILEDFWGE